jgi:hypothetical protein
VEQQFIECFMISYHKDSLLPSIFAEYRLSPTCEYAYRAGTMAFYGKLTGDLVIQMEASRWYQKSLQVQITKLNRDSALEKCRPRSVEDILIPMMLCLFESSICTSMMGWVHHVGAGAKLLENIGPVACQTIPLHNIFLTLRLNSVRLAVSLAFSFRAANQDGDTAISSCDLG